MARPVKTTVDYFPHQTDHGRTIFILESRWGNDGYAFWFKLLEVLGKKPGMFIDLETITEWEFLLAKTRVDEETANNILNTLSNLGAIEPDFWTAKVVYCQNFVNGVADAFRRRKEVLPDRNMVIDYINTAKPEFMCAFVGKGKGKGKGKEKEKGEDDTAIRKKLGDILIGSRSSVVKLMPHLGIDNLYEIEGEKWIATRASSGRLRVDPRVDLIKWMQKVRTDANRGSSGDKGNGGKNQQREISTGTGAGGRVDL